MEHDHRVFMLDFKRFVDTIERLAEEHRRKNELEKLRMEYEVRPSPHVEFKQRLREI